MITAAHLVVKLLIAVTVGIHPEGGLHPMGRV